MNYFELFHIPIKAQDDIANLDESPELDVSNEMPESDGSEEAICPPEPANGACIAVTSDIQSLMPLKVRKRNEQSS